MKNIKNRNTFIYVITSIIKDTTVLLGFTFIALNVGVDVLIHKFLRSIKKTI
jgi:hypothetical protein